MRISYMDFSKNLDPKKAALLNNFAAMAKGKSTEDMLPLLMAVTNKAKKEGISFTQEEMSSVIEIFKKDLTAQEQKKLDFFLQMMQNV